MSARADTTTARPAADGTLTGARVGVLLGGRSTEREISLVTGAAVCAALSRPAGPDDARGPERVVRVELLADGRFAIDGVPHEPGAALDALRGLDVLFLGLHGGEGEGGAVQGFLRTAGIPFTGSDVAASAVSLDKVFARQVLGAHGVRVAPGREVTRGAWRTEREEVRAHLRELRGPRGWIVKPRCGGSSVATALVADEAGLDAALDAAHACEPSALVEACLRGVELTGGIVTAPDGALRALTPVEIRPHPGRFFDYEEKYDADGASELCPPESADDATCERVRALALLAHRVLGCAGYSRSDFLVPEGEREPVFLELNTLPGLTDRSLLPQAAAVDGLDFRTLCLWIAAEGLRRGRDA